jgi:glycosyltransferase involved in cell wall biosynthesis
VNVTIVSPCRDVAHWVERYRGQVEALTHPYAALRVVVVEGDSIDGTWRIIEAWAAQDDRVTVVKCDTGRQRYGSVVHPERFITLAQVFNAGLDAVDTEWSDFVLFLPFDIVYQPDLLQRLVAHDVDMVSPFVWQGAIFYDIWAFRRAGSYFVNFDRGHAERHMGTELMDMDSIGGTMLMRAEIVARGCRYTAENVDRGLCDQAARLGYRMWADPTTHVEHGA